MDQQTQATNEATTLNLVRDNIQISVLCGHERHFWLAPDLFLGLSTSLVNRAYEGISTGDWENIDLLNAYDWKTSQEARNEATNHLLSGSSEWLLMIDNDTKLMNASGPVDPFRLVDCAVKHNLLVVSAPVPVLQGKNWYINVFKRSQSPENAAKGWHSPVGLKELNAWEQDPHTPVPVDAVGTGMILIHRAVFECLQKEHFDGLEGVIKSLEPNEVFDRPLVRWWDGFTEQALDLQVPHWLRPRDPWGRTIIGEDLFFSERCRQLGIQPYTLPSLYCGHPHTVDLARIPEILFSLSDPPSAADFGLESLHGLTPGPMSIEPWQAKALRELVWEAPREQLSELTSKGIVVEFGGGVSTWVLGSENDGLALVTVETDEGQRERLRKSPAHVVSEFGDIPQYVRFLGVEPCVVLVFVDGPQVTPENPTARFNTLPQIPESLLVPGCLVVVDDYNRASEKDAVKFWKSRLQGTLEVKRVLGPPFRQMAVFTYQPSK